MWLVSAVDRGLSVVVLFLARSFAMYDVVLMFVSSSVFCFLPSRRRGKRRASHLPSFTERDLSQGRQGQFLNQLLLSKLVMVGGGRTHAQGGREISP